MANENYDLIMGNNTSRKLYRDFDVTSIHTPEHWDKAGWRVLRARRERERERETGSLIQSVSSNFRTSSPTVTRSLRNRYVFEKIRYPSILLFLSLKLISIRELNFYRDKNKKQLRKERSSSHAILNGIRKKLDFINIVFITRKRIINVSKKKKEHVHAHFNSFIVM